MRFPFVVSQKYVKINSYMCVYTVHTMIRSHPAAFLHYEPFFSLGSRTLRGRREEEVAVDAIDRLLDCDCGDAGKRENGQEKCVSLFSACHQLQLHVEVKIRITDQHTEHRTERIVTFYTYRRILSGARTVSEHLVMHYVPSSALMMCWTARPHMICSMLCIIMSY